MSKRKNYFDDLRIQNELHFSKEFHSDDVVVILMPNGLCLEPHFDQSDTRAVYLSLIQLIHYAFLYAFIPDPRRGFQGVSYIDWDKLSKIYFQYIPKVDIQIDKPFYQKSSWKKPVHFAMTLARIELTTYTIGFTLESVDSSTRYAHGLCSGICVNRSTRKISELPKWWREKYVPLLKDRTLGHSSKLERMIIPEIASKRCCPYTIQKSDIDENGHTNWITYIRECYDACLTWKTSGLEKQVENEMQNKRVKKINITFMKDTRLHDRLDIFSWTEPKTIHFVMKKNHESCCFGEMEYYGFDSSSSSKL